MSSADATPESDDPATPQSPIRPGGLFLAFSQMALSGFGGVMPFAYRFLVEKRGWLRAEQFAEMVALGQVLPGPTICNVSIMVGWRFAGVRGALAALSGMLTGPVLVVLLLGAGYQRFGTLPPVHADLTGMSAVAAGLIISTALKMALRLWQVARAPLVKSSSCGFAVLAFVGVGLLHWPLIAVVTLLAPFAIGIAFFAIK